MKKSRLKQIIQEEIQNVLGEMHVNPPGHLKNFWYEMIYNYFKNTQGIFRNSGIEQKMRSNSSKILDKIWEFYTENFQEDDLRDAEEDMLDIESIPTKKHDLLNPDKETGASNDSWYYMIMEFLFPYISEHLKKNGWEHESDTFFIKGDDGIDIFWNDINDIGADTSPSELVQQRMSEYFDENY